MKHVLLAAVAVATLAMPAEAAVTPGPVVGGLTTFTDTNTGLNWAKLDNFFGLTHNQMAALVGAAGFTVALRSDVETLLGTLPLGGGEWASYAAIMGKAPNRQLIWGSYDPVSSFNQVGWAFAYDTDANWNFDNDTFDADTVPNDGGDFADMNIWAFTTEGGVIPEPATWAMLIAGFGLVGSAMRRRRGAVAA